jgi:hypothetical protein
MQPGPEGRAIGLLSTQRTTVRRMWGACRRPATVTRCWSISVPSIGVSSSGSDATGGGGAAPACVPVPRHPWCHRVDSCKRSGSTTIGIGQLLHGSVKHTHRGSVRRSEGTFRSDLVMRSISRSVRFSNEVLSTVDLPIVDSDLVLLTFPDDHADLLTLNPAPEQQQPAAQSGRPALRLHRSRHGPRHLGCDDRGARSIRGRAGQFPERRSPSTARTPTDTRSRSTGAISGHRRNATRRASSTADSGSSRPRRRVTPRSPDGGRVSQNDRPCR